MSPRQHEFNPREQGFLHPDMAGWNRHGFPLCSCACVDALADDAYNVR